MTNRTITSLLNENPIATLEISEWISKEYEFWNNMFSTILQDNSLIDGFTAKKYMKLLSQLLESSGTKEEIDLKKLRDALDTFEPTFLPHHDDTIVERIKQQGVTQERANLILLFYVISRSSFESVIQEQYENRYEKQISHSVGRLDELSSSFIETHQNAMNSVDKGRKKLEGFTDTLVSEMTEAIQSSARAEKTTISELSLSIQKEIRSNEPVTFWEGKEARHRLEARSCRRVAIGLGVCASTVLTLLVFAAFKDQDTTTLLGFRIPNHFYIAISILIGSAFVWALKVAVQLMMTHIALEAEALEKSTAIKTYVALSGHIKDPDIEKEFHKSLLSFNKIKIADDSNHPDLLKLIEQFLNKKKDPS